MRIVSVLPSGTEFIYALGRSSCLVGVSDHCDFPPYHLKNLSRLGPFLRPCLEAILDLHPDLVLLDGTYQGQLAQDLSRHGCRWLDGACRKAEEIGLFAVSLGKALGCPERGESLRFWFEANWRRWERWSAGLTVKRPRVVRLLTALPDGRAIVAGGDTLQGRALDLAGYENGAASLAGYVVVEAERDFYTDLDGLVLCTFGPQRKTLADDGSLLGWWEDLPVVRSRSFVTVPCSLLCRATHRWFTLLDLLARQAHPSWPSYSPWRC
ncbi:MAG: ABC transporter substrate-binding protein [Synergistaceae bacterium]|nr:ABC transporter substrate-binding protein [Synergistaceae bacterium]